LSKAPQFQNESTPVSVRFSDFTGLPHIPDNDNDAKPSGIGIRFNLGLKDGKRRHTDIIGHSVPHFPVQTGAQFAEFFKAAGASTPGTPSPTPIEQFLGSHPAALRFAQAPKPFTESWATESYYALNAFKFISTDGTETWIRYQVHSDAGRKTISEEEAKSKGPNYLVEEIAKRVKDGPVGLKLVAQIAEKDDPTNDITKEWPENRKVVELGSIKLEKLDENSEKDQKHAIFDPIPRVEGIEPSDDPILEFRAALYLLSGRERRAA
jgi:catalase